MTTDNPVITDPAQYGSRGQEWHPDFVDYMVQVYGNASYKNMPDALKEDGKIQWEAPSNRSGGLYQFTHQKRADWWKAKASEVGIDLNSGTWISETAKRIHPFGEKPCKRCGRMMRIAYSYPNAHIKRRLTQLYGNKIEYDPFEPIEELLTRIVSTLGNDAYSSFNLLLASKNIAIPSLGNNLEKWLEWVKKVYIPQEPTVLSPGAMSNAPDRFDGFHSFNLCCRKLADSGRSDANLRSYTTDRRVFEYWSEGNWIAADRLMGLVNSQFRDEPTADGGQPPATADHIGPLSLGFMHRPEFRLLSKAANSAKNNRMTAWDVEYLISVEASGVHVVSWHAKRLWDLRKEYVKDEETALRISKLLRDNQRNFVHLLYEIYKRKQFAFLITLLELEHAENKVSFENLRFENFVSKYDKLVLEKRDTKYTVEQKARRIRIGLDALKTYGEKLNRHNVMLLKSEMEPSLNKAIHLLGNAGTEFDELNKQVAVSLDNEPQLRALIVKQLSDTNLHTDTTKQIKLELSNAMDSVAETISKMWEDERYVRAPFDFESE